MIYDKAEDEMLLLFALICNITSVKLLFGHSKTVFPMPLRTNNLSDAWNSQSLRPTCATFETVYNSTQLTRRYTRFDT